MSAVNNTLATPGVYDPFDGLSAAAKRLWLEHPNLTKSHVRQVARLESTKHTNQMTRRELAMVYAAHVGHASREGGWIYTANDTPIVQGWEAYGERMVRAGRIVVGKGINWNKKGR